MVYHIQNRTIFRGFHSDVKGKTKITLSTGSIVKGKWLTGRIIEVPRHDPSGNDHQMPLLCIVPHGKNMEFVSQHSVFPETISQYSGLATDTEWDALSKGKMEKWLKAHAHDVWTGIPVFEGDLLLHRITKKMYVVVYHQTYGFFLQDTETGERERLVDPSLYQHKGNLWQPPKDILPKSLLRYHAFRVADRGEKPCHLIVDGE